VFRSDAPELLPHDDDVRRLSEQTVTLAELLTEHTDGWDPPTTSIRPAKALVQIRSADPTTAILARRLQLPHPDRAARRTGAARDPPGRAAHGGEGSKSEPLIITDVTVGLARGSARW
jgi:hypothetical protein